MLEILFRTTPSNGRHVVFQRRESLARGVRIRNERDILYITLCARTLATTQQFASKTIFYCRIESPLDRFIYHVLVYIVSETYRGTVNKRTHFRLNLFYRLSSRSLPSQYTCARNSLLVSWRAVVLQNPRIPLTIRNLSEHLDNTL